MGSNTIHYGLKTLRSGDNLSDDDYAFTDKNIVKLDTLAWLGAEGHQHTGSNAIDVTPADGPSLVLTAGTGTIPGGRTVRYKYSLVDAQGQESAASPETTVTTPPAVSTPGGPTLTAAYTGGTLLAGQYYYVLTAYKTTINQETVGSRRGYATLLSGTTGEITLTLPSLPTGATGFNVYRRSPGSTRFQYLASVDMSVATPPTTYVDDGTDVEDCNRTVPTANNTSSNYAVAVGFPGATPTVPAGYTWKVYRTYTTGDWDSSLASWVVAETTEGSGIITPEYSDVGAATSGGSPLANGEQIGAPSKINLTDAIEVQGELPPGMISAYDEIMFAQGGTVVAVTGTIPWVCEHEVADIIHVRAATGPNTPTSYQIIVDVNKYDGQAATPTWTTVFTTQANRPKVQSGQWIGAVAVPNVTRLYRGDALMVDIDQGDESATPTAENLVVTVFMIVHSGSATTTWVR
jgi:hypothetical protein